MDLPGSNAPQELEKFIAPGGRYVVNTEVKRTTFSYES